MLDSFETSCICPQEELLILFVNTFLALLDSAAAQLLLMPSSMPLIGVKL